MLEDSVVLLCQHCGGRYLDHESIETFHRKYEDAKTGFHLKLDIFTNQLTFNDNLERNPSSRRGGIIINFSCEDCGEITMLKIIQHKGCTRVENFITENKN